MCTQYIKQAISPVIRDPLLAQAGEFIPSHA